MNIKLNGCQIESTVRQLAPHVEAPINIADHRFYGKHLSGVRGKVQAEVGREAVCESHA